MKATTLIQGDIEFMTLRQLKDKMKMKHVKGQLEVVV
jgi:hypothetical protein